MDAGSLARFPVPDGLRLCGRPLAAAEEHSGSIADVAAVQRGGRLIVQFTPPTLTTEGLPVPTPLRIDLRVGTAVIRSRRKGGRRRRSRFPKSR